MVSKTALYFGLLSVICLPLVALATPTIESASCSISNELRDGSSSTGALEDTMCLLRVGFRDNFSSNVEFRNIGGEEIFGCLVAKGQRTCEFDSDELEALNSVIQGANVNPRLLGASYTDRGPLARRYGCMQVSGGNRVTTSPFVTPTPQTETGSQIGTKCRDDENCSLDITYQYTCLTLPEPSTPAFPQCRANYRACVAENLRLQVELGRCRNSIAISVPLTDFSGGLPECSEHLGSCRLSNFQLGTAISNCAR